MSPLGARACQRGCQAMSTISAVGAWPSRSSGAHFAVSFESPGRLRAQRIVDDLGARGCIQFRSLLDDVSNSRPQPEWRRRTVVARRLVGPAGDDSGEADPTLSVGGRALASSVATAAVTAEVDHLAVEMEGSPELRWLRRDESMAPHGAQAAEAPPLTVMAFVRGHRRSPPGSLRSPRTSWSRRRPRARPRGHRRQR